MWTCDCGISKTVVAGVAAFGIATGVSAGLKSFDSDEVASVKNVTERFESGWNNEDLDLLRSTFTDPHVDVNANPQTESLESKLSKIGQMFDVIDSSLEVTSDEVLVSGDLAVQRGEFTLRYTPPGGGEEVEITRRYVEVLERQADGVWKVRWGIDAPIEGAGQ
ncbi:MAG: YybH family protein [Planctomycetota bacterium]|jgi:ketosteroid isomerase-like protein